jgi:hypothetical protein
VALWLVVRCSGLLARLAAVSLAFWVGDMNELFAQLFGQSPSYANALFGEDEAARLRQQAQQQGLLNVGLSLLAGSGPSPQRRGVGQLLAQGVAAGQQAYQGAYDKAVRDRMLQEQLAERQQLRQEQQMAQQAFQQAFVPREVFSIDPISGERVATGVTPPMLDKARLQGILGSLTPGALSQVLKQTAAVESAFAPKRMTLKEGEQLLEETPEGFRQVAGIPKPEKLPSAIEEYNFAVKGGYKGTFEQFKQLNRPVTTVNVGEGQKGFENEMKLAGAFKAEPVYKAFDEMRGSFQQITTGLNQKSPAGDLTAATKFMKLLDPGSVVRESELFLAMQATGALDRFTDVANKIISGTKLTEQQRADFRNVAEQLYNAAATSYNTKRDEYLQFGQSQGLKGAILLGQPAKTVAGGQIPFQMPSVQQIDELLKKRLEGI